MSPVLEPRILVPVELLTEEQVPMGATVELVSAVPIVLLGYREVPDQTAPGQMRMQFEEQATAELEQKAEAFEAAGGEVETRLVFTHDLGDTFTRVANEEACTAVLLARPSQEMASLLVPIRGDVNLERVVDVVARLLAQTSLHATLLHIVEPEEAQDAGQMLLEGARGFLEDRDVDPERVRLQVQPSEDPLEALVEAAQGHDAVVLGETDPSLGELIFGEAHERVAADFDGPIVVVRRTVGGEAPAVPEE